MMLRKSLVLCWAMAAGAGGACDRGGRDGGQDVEDGGADECPWDVPSETAAPGFRFAHPRYN